VPTLDEQIARHLQEALASGELQKAEGFGKPLAEIPGWSDTPEALRMPFKILKDSGFAPPEVTLFHERADLRQLIAGCTDAAEKARLQAALNQLEQQIAVRLEALRVNARL
jgi:hypothetical protein